jgi:hypothetical protein
LRLDGWHRPTFLFDSDFADLFEVRARGPRGAPDRQLLSPADVSLEYQGLDGKTRTTRLHSIRAPLYLL